MFPTSLFTGGTEIILRVGWECMYHLSFPPKTWINKWSAPPTYLQLTHTPVLRNSVFLMLLRGQEYMSLERLYAFVWIQVLHILQMNIHEYVSRWTNKEGHARMSSPITRHLIKAGQGWHTEIILGKNHEILKQNYVWGISCVQRITDEVGVEQESEGNMEMFWGSKNHFPNFIWEIRGGRRDRLGGKEWWSEPLALNRIWGWGKSSISFSVILSQYMRDIIKKLNHSVLTSVDVGVKMPVWFLSFIIVFDLLGPLPLYVNDTCHSPCKG